MSESVTAITSYEQFQSVIAKDTPVLIDFWAEWCGPCKAIAPVLKKYADEIKEAGGALEFYKVNIDDLPNVAGEVSIRVVPTFIVFKNGSKIKELQGAAPGPVKALIEQVNQI